MQHLDLGLLIHISVLITTEHATQHVQGYFSVKCSLSISAELRQETRKKGPLCTNQEAGNRSVCAGTPLLFFNSGAKCVTTFSQDHP